MTKAGSVLLAVLIPLTLGSSCEPSSPDIFLLAISNTGAGTGTAIATPAGNADNGYEKGTAVTITATASANSDFAGWDETDVRGCTEPKNPCTITMDDRKSVVARFVLNSGAARFDGPYSGKVPTPTNGTAQMELTLVNGVVAGKVTPLYGSVNSFSGTVSATGAFTATVNPGVGSNCATNLTGTFTTSLVDGITTATASGTWQVVSTGGIGCGASPPGQPLPSGSWSATRNAVHVASVFQ